MHDSIAVKEYYNRNVEREWDRMERHPIEFAVTRRLLERFLPPPPARILDAGGGPGRYALHLASLGYEVTLFDLSPENTAFARRKAAEMNLSLAGIVTGNVLELDSHIQGEYDAVLLMGPLYHLTELSDRVQAVRQCLGRLAPGGMFLAAFISCYAPILDMMKKSPESVLTRADTLLGYRDNGVNIETGTAGFTNAWFQHPDSISPFMARFPLKEQGVFGVESMMGCFEARLLEAAPEVFEACIDLAMHFIDDPACRAGSEHFLYVGSKITGE